MPKILVLAQSGFGKSTSIGKTENPELGINIQGLNPENTYILSMTSKPLPFKGSSAMFPVTTLDKMKDGKRIICKNAMEVETCLTNLINSPFKNIVVDDFNYITNSDSITFITKRKNQVFSFYSILILKIII